MNTVVEVGPTEGTNALVFTDQPLLNRSLSDLKLPGHLQVKHDLQPKLHSSSGQKNVINDSRESVTAQNEPCNQYKSINEDKETLSEDSAIDSSEHFFSHESQAASRLKPPSIGDHADIPHGDSLWSSPGVRGHPSMEDMAEMCKLIGDQKGVIMNCLVSENCDIVTLNQQISVLKNMQEDYAKLEFELSRNLWITAQNSSNKETLPEDNLRSFDEQFSTLVEQEVDRRLFQVRPELPHFEQTIYFTHSS